MTWLQNILPQMGYAFVCSFWQMAVLYAIYKLAAGIYLPSPAERFRFAFGLSLAGSAWFLYTVAFGSPATDWQISSIKQIIPFSIPGLFNQTMYWLGWGYLGILAYASIKGRLQWKTTTKIMGSGFTKAPVEWRIFTEKHAGLLGIKRKVALKISGTFTPATYGYLKPVILLPVSCLTGLNTNQLQAILLHELAHIRRGDYLAAWIMQVAGILLWFNPFMRLLIREAKSECENACDDLVMQFEYDPFHYAQALLSVAKNGQSLGWALQAQGSHQHLLLNRIARLLGQPANQFKFSLKNFGWTLLSAGLFFTTGWLAKNKNTAQVLAATNVLPPSMPLPQPSLNQSLQDASFSMLAAAASNSVAAEKEQLAEKMKELQVAETKEWMANRQTEELAEVEDRVSPPSLILSANWADEQQAEKGFQEIETGWKQFTHLLEKLELKGDLEENEWKQVAGLITLYADIRNSIYKETARSQQYFNNYASGIDADLQDKVLVIVHEESTGTLAASFMYPDEINEELTADNLPENRQQVILLRKKAPNGKKITRL